MSFSDWLATTALFKFVWFDPSALLVKFVTHSATPPPLLWMLVKSPRMVVSSETSDVADEPLICDLARAIRDFRLVMMAEMPPDPLYLIFQCCCAKNCHKKSRLPHGVRNRQRQKCSLVLPVTLVYPHVSDIAYTTARGAAADQIIYS